MEPSFAIRTNELKVFACIQPNFQDTFFSWDKKREEKTAQLFNSVDLLFLALFDIKWRSVLRKKTHYLPFLHICYAHILIPSIYTCVLNNTHTHLHSSTHKHLHSSTLYLQLPHTRTLTSTLANQNTLSSTCMNLSANTDPYSTSTNPGAHTHLHKHV